MPGPYDTVVSIGGQSFLDGLWRLLGPALEGLTNPLPIAIPGFANAQMRVTQLVPVFPGPTPATGALILRGNVEVTGEALLHLLVESGTANIALGSQTLSLTNLAGPIALPAQTGALTNIAIGGTVGTLPAALTGGTGDLTLPANTANLAGGTGDGTLALPGNLALPGIPLPAVVPVAVDLTHGGTLGLQATVVLTVTGPGAATRFGLLFTVSDVTVTTIAGTISAATLTATLQAAVDQIVGQLAVPVTIPQTPVDAGAVATLIAPIPGLVRQAFDDALTSLLAETGRLIYPTAGTGASCDVKVLPTAADAALTVATGGSYVLQVGFKRAGSTDIAAFPTITAPIECQVIIGNSFLLGLMCCLVERLPAFCLPVAATTGTTDVAGATHTRCCNFTSVAANFGGVTLAGGGLSVCIDGSGAGPKVFSLVGTFSQSVGLSLPVFGTTVNLGSIGLAADFTLPLAFDLDDAASIANLRLFGAQTISASVTPNMTGTVILVFILAILVPIAAVLTGLLAPLGALLGAVLAAVVVLIIILLVQVACAVATRLLRNAVRMLLGGASLLRSPIALPPGLFEAFGRLAPASVTVDDLEANGVLHTPTSVWGLLPRIGPKPRPFDDFPLPDDSVFEKPEPGQPPVPNPGGGPGTTQPGGKTTDRPGGQTGTVQPGQPAADD